LLAALVLTLGEAAAFGQAAAAKPGAPATAAPAAASRGLTEVPGLKVGHYTYSERPTGCTVILAEPAAVGAVDVRGGAPGTRETDLLRPENHVQTVNAVVLSGGSAFGLESATGVVRWLDERGIGYEARVAKVPIVPAAILFDLGMGNAKVRPGADCGYKAAEAATDGPVAEGSVGAGAGATVGKMGGPARSMKGGLGSAALRLPNGLVVAALVAVNAVGDVVDPATGKVVAGVRTEDGKGLADVRELIRSGAILRRARPPMGEGPPRPGENTTIGLVATSAALSKTQAHKMAQMAHDGFARAISPVHTTGDGDVIFALATGARAGAVTDQELTLIGALGAEAMADAILRSVRQATSAAGVPALRDLAPRP
jgi:L-aminopeptidase/D-esterase-like protein